jgi:Na+-transporting NADH:ubiquinone oxidoreductase subunit NqrE
MDIIIDIIIILTITTIINWFVYRDIKEEENE